MHRNRQPGACAVLCAPGVCAPSALFSASPSARSGFSGGPLWGFPYIFRIFRFVSSIGALLPEAERTMAEDGEDGGETFQPQMVRLSDLYADAERKVRATRCMLLCVPGRRRKATRRHLPPGAGARQGTCRVGHAQTESVQTVPAGRASATHARTPRRWASGLNRCIKTPRGAQTWSRQKHTAPSRRAVDGSPSRSRAHARARRRPRSCRCTRVCPNLTARGPMGDRRSCGDRTQWNSRRTRARRATRRFGRLAQVRPGTWRGGAGMTGRMGGAVGLRGMGAVMVTRTAPPSRMLLTRG